MDENLLGRKTWRRFRKDGKVEGTLGKGGRQKQPYEGDQPQGAGPRNAGWRRLAGGGCSCVRQGSALPILSDFRGSSREHRLRLPWENPVTQEVGPPGLPGPRPDSWRKAHSGRDPSIENPERCGPNNNASKTRVRERTLKTTKLPLNINAAIHQTPWTKKRKP